MTNFDPVWNVEWLSDEETGRLSDIKVVPVTVIRKGILPGCTKESITCLDAKNRSFDTIASDYFATESEAWSNAIKELQDTIDISKDHIKDIKKDIASYQTVLDKLINEHGW